MKLERALRAGRYGEVSMWASQLQELEESAPVANSAARKHVIGADTIAALLKGGPF